MVGLRDKPWCALSALLLASAGCDEQTPDYAGRGPGDAGGVARDAGGQGDSGKIDGGLGSDAAALLADSGADGLDASQEDGTVGRFDASPRDGEVAPVDAEKDAEMGHALVDAGPIDPLDATCFAGGTELTGIAGTGTCTDPFLVDLADGALDDVWYFVTPASASDQEVSPQGKCGVGLPRDFVFNITLPPGSDLEVSVDALSGSNTALLAQDGPNADCSKADTRVCVDESGEAQCEYARLRAGSDVFDPALTTQLVISEVVNTAQPLILRLRLRDPGTGS